MSITTTQDLINLLKELPQDLPIFIQSEECSGIVLKELKVTSHELIFPWGKPNTKEKVLVIENKK